MADGYTGAGLFYVERDSRQDIVWTLIMPQCFQAASLLVLFVTKHQVWKPLKFLDNSSKPLRGSP